MIGITVNVLLSLDLLRKISFTSIKSNKIFASFFAKTTSLVHPYLILFDQLYFVL